MLEEGEPKLFDGDQTAATSSRIGWTRSREEVPGDARYGLVGAWRAATS
jgi:hypothetical protein